ncbi:MAG: phenylalanine--tRNA ligase subunit beta, partial [Flavobacteriales bacterium]|nr:phenylalanine--tRNA ligase subunit beta [Flavobacteriales bacterium]
LRSSLLFSTLESIGFNLNRQAKNLKFFEIGKTYATTEEGFEEKKYAALSLVGNPYSENWDSSEHPSPFSYFKGVIENIWTRLGMSFSDYQYTEHPTLAEGVEWKLGKTTLGYMGIVKAEIAKEFNIDKTVYYATLDWELILKYAFSKNLTLTPIPKFPTSRRDFALLVSKEVSFQAIEKLAYQTERKLLQKVGLFDVYEGKNLPENQKSYGVSFAFQDPNKTLTDKQIDKIMKKLQDRFAQELEAKLR